MFFFNMKFVVDVYDHIYAPRYLCRRYNPVALPGLQGMACTLTAPPVQNPCPPGPYDVPVQPKAVRRALIGAGAAARRATSATSMSGTRWRLATGTTCTQAKLPSRRND